MKIRTGFVSNSSSNSFVILKEKLSKEQISKLLTYQDSKENLDGWSINEISDTISGFTIMDNGEINPFINSLNIYDNDIEWEDY